MTLQDRITQATRHVEAGRRVIARQRELVATGIMGLAAEDLLELFERSQDIFETDLADLLMAQRQGESAGCSGAVGPVVPSKS